MISFSSSFKEEICTWLFISFESFGELFLDFFFFLANASMLEFFAFSCRFIFRFRGIIPFFNRLVKCFLSVDEFRLDSIKFFTFTSGVVESYLYRFIFSSSWVIVDEPILSALLSALKMLSSCFKSCSMELMDSWILLIPGSSSAAASSPFFRAVSFNLSNVLSIPFGERRGVLECCQCFPSDIHVPTVVFSFLYLIVWFCKVQVRLWQTGLQGRFFSRKSSFSCRERVFNLDI